MNHRLLKNILELAGVQNWILRESPGLIPATVILYLDGVDEKVCAKIQDIIDDIVDARFDFRVIMFRYENDHKLQSPSQSSVFISDSPFDDDEVKI